MKTFVALAAACAAALIAGTASAEDARIAWGDLDLGTAAGAAAFDARIGDAAHRMCRDAKRPGCLISDRDYCVAAVRAEAVRQLPGSAQVDYAIARTPTVA